MPYFLFILIELFFDDFSSLDRSIVILVKWPFWSGKSLDKRIHPIPQNIDIVRNCNFSMQSNKRLKTTPRYNTLYYKGTTSISYSRYKEVRRKSFWGFSIPINGISYLKHGEDVFMRANELPPLLRSLDFCVLHHWRCWKVWRDVTMDFELQFFHNFLKHEVPFRQLLKWDSEDDFLSLTLLGIKNTFDFGLLCCLVFFYSS